VYPAADVYVWFCLDVLRLMCGEVMHRTQIYLDDDEVALLTQESARTGASRSELIRRAVRSQYGADTPERRLAALRASAGIWSDRSSTGAVRRGAA
jgi:metal-responsive CopG/Arc/MetJ family transcriptional regulator